MTTVTESPNRARLAPIRPPTPPTPRIACRRAGMRLLLQRRDRHALENLSLAERVVALLGALVDAVDNVVGSRNIVALKPEEHVRLATHRSDVDDLVKPEHVGGHSGVDRVGQYDIILVIGLDDRCRMHAGRGAECVVANYRIIARDWHSGRARYRFAIF